MLHSSNASTGKAGEVWKDCKTETPGDTMEIIRSHTTVLQPQFAALLAHSQPKPGLVQAVRRAKQWLCWIQPLASTLHNPSHMCIPTRSSCEIWVPKGGEFEALKHVSWCIASLQKYFMGLFFYTCYIQQTNRCRSPLDETPALSCSCSHLSPLPLQYSPNHFLLKKTSKKNSKITIL